MLRVLLSSRTVSIVVSLLLLFSGGANSDAFLSSELPLTVAISTPVELLQAPALKSPVQLFGSQALQVIWDHVIMET